jgi:hypothetical protein
MGEQASGAADGLSREQLDGANNGALAEADKEEDSTPCFNIAPQIGPET